MKKHLRFFTSCLLFLTITIVNTFPGVVLAQEAYAGENSEVTQSSPSQIDTALTLDIPINETSEDLGIGSILVESVLEEPVLEMSDIEAVSDVLPEELSSDDEGQKKNTKTDTDPLNNESQKDKTGDQPVTLSATSGGSTSDLEAPKMTVAKIERPSVNKSSGDLGYSYSLSSPSARGLNPSLNLNYSSGRKNNVNIAGYGWDLNIPSISRVNKSGVEKLYQRTDFESSFDGELLNVGQTNYLPKIVSGPSSKYLFENGVWTMTDSNQNTYYFGKSDEAKESDPQNLTRVYRWYLDEVVDKNGNSIKYFYTKDSGQVYPQKITYAGRQDANGPYEILFNYESRQDTLKNYASGFEIKSNQRLKNITLNFEDSWFKKYDISYTVGANQVRSLISSITETGKSQDGEIKSLPPTKFEYSESTPGWNLAPTYSPPVAPFVTRQSQTRDSGVRSFDINADGLTDRGINDYKLNKGDGTWQDWSSSMSLPLSPVLPDTNLDSGVRFADLNGDLVADMVVGFGVAKHNPYNTDGMYPRADLVRATSTVYLNKKDTWQQASTWDVTSFTIVKYGESVYADTYDVADRGVRILDLNGDGLADQIGGRELGNLEHFNTRINNGLGFTEVSAIKFPGSESFAEWNSFADTGLRTVDVNADGLVDLARNTDISNNYNQLENQNIVYLNTGNDNDGFWRSTSEITIPEFTRMTNVPWQNGFRFEDFTGDGLSDILVSYVTYDASGSGVLTRKAYVGTGLGWTLSNEWAPPSSIPFYTNRTSSGNTITESGWVENFDINGDMMSDLVVYPTDGTSSSKNTHLNTSSIPDVLLSIENPRGGVVEVKYKASTQLRDQNSNLLNPNLPIQSLVVTEIIEKPGNGEDEISKKYTYSGGSFFYQSPENRRPAGFEEVTEETADSITKTYYHQGNGVNALQNEKVDSDALIGIQYKTIISDKNGKVFASSRNDFETLVRGNGQKFVKGVVSVESIYNPDGTKVSNAKTYTHDDSTGNILSESSLGDVSVNATDVITDLGTDSIQAEYLYASFANGAQSTMPYSMIMKDNAGNKFSEKKIYYDNSALGTLNIGNQTREESRIDANDFASTTSTYNSFGLVTETKDPNGNSTSYVYDSYNFFPVTVTNALGQSNDFTFNYLNGKLASLQDQNGQMTSYSYDPLGRLKSVSIPDPVTSGLQVLKENYVYTDTQLNLSVKKTDYLDGTNGVESYVYFDGLGRILQTKTEAEDNKWVTADNAYDSKGRVVKESLPYFSSSSVKDSPTINLDLYKSMNYDSLDRVASVSTSVGTKQISYNNRSNQVTDENGHVKVFHSDAFGNLIKVDEINGASTYTTNYTYNSQNKLTKIVDSLNNVRNFTYDFLGRQKGIEDLHAPSDTTFGTYQYSYDPAGNLTQKITPKNETIQYTYDKLNRNLTENYTGNAGTEIVYTYDACTLGIGRVCSITSSGVSENFDYTPQGKVKNQTKVIDGISYILNYSYDRLGNVLSSTNPDLSVVLTNYNSAGQPETVFYKESGTATSTPIVLSAEYGAHGATTRLVYANGTKLCNTFDSEKLYRLTGKRTTANNFDCTSVPQTESTTTSVTTYVPTVTYINSTSTVATTTKFYAKPFDGHIVSAPKAGAWSAQHDSGTGLSVSTTATTLEVGIYDDNKTTSSSARKIIRGFLNFDTQTIPDNAQVTDARLYLTPNSITNQFADGKNYLAIHKANTASASALSTSDYDMCDTISNPKLLSATTSISTLAVGTSKLFQFNLEGLSAVSATSTSRFCVREGHDALNSRPTGLTSTVKKSSVILRSVEQSGTASDPYLLVSYNYPVVTSVATTTLVATTTSVTTPNLLSDKTYAYDNVGNILSVIETASVSQPRSVTYSYDALDRLLSATTLVSSSTPSTINYSYNSLGNILTNASTTYAYAGTGYANPHAVTQVGSFVLTYDNSGNLLKDGILNNTWDYRNRLTQTTGAMGTTTYAYDHTTERVKKTIGAISTIYPTDSYEVTGATTTKSILMNGKLIASINKVASSTPVTTFTHQDHLGSTHLVTDLNGVVIQTLDYYPYGKKKVETGNSANNRQFIGEVFDVNTSLSYLNARYYNGERGQFLSQDPASFFQPSQFLADPQQLNLYSYARGNPIRYSDPSGLSPRDTIGALAKGSIEIPVRLVTGAIDSIFHPVATAKTIGESVKNIPQNAVRAPENIKVLGQSYMQASDTDRGYMLAGFAGFAMSMATPEFRAAKMKALADLPDSALVCRSGGCSPKDFRDGTGVAEHPDGTISKVSVNIQMNNESKADLLNMGPERLRGEGGGFSTMGQLRDAVTSFAPTGKTFNHFDLSELSPEKFSSLFTDYFEE